MVLRRLQSTFDAINLLFRCFNAPFGFLLERMQNIDGRPELDCVYSPIGVTSSA